MGLIDWSGAGQVATPSAPSSGGLINWGSVYKSHVASQTAAARPVVNSLDNEKQQLRQQQLAKGINNPSSLINLQAQLHNNQITPQQFTQQFPKASSLGDGLDARGNVANPQAPKLTPAAVASSAVQSAGSLAQTAKNDVTSAYQHVNPFSGVNNANSLIKQTQQQFGLTPQFTKLLQSNNTSTTTGKLPTGGAQAVTYKPGTAPNAINRTQININPEKGAPKGSLDNLGTTPASVLVHEGLHQAWFNSTPQQKQTFESAYNQAAGQDKGLQVYLNDALGVNGQQNLSDITKLPPALQDEIHSATARYYLDQQKIDPSNPLNKYYSQYLNLGKGNDNYSNAQKITTNTGKSFAQGVGGIAKNVVKSITQPIEQIPADATLALSSTISKALGKGPITAKTITNTPNSPIHAGVKYAGATGSPRQLASDVAQTGLLAAGGPADSAAAKVASKVLPEAAAKVVGPTLANTGLGYGIGASGALGNGQNLKQANKIGLENAVAGGALTLGGLGLAKGAETATTALGKNQSVNDLINNTRTKAVQDHFPAEGGVAPKTPPTPVESQAGKSVGRARAVANTPPEQPQLTGDQSLSQEETAPKTAKLNEVGGVPIGQVVGNVQDMVAKHQAVTKATGDIEHDYALNQGQTQDVKLDVAKSLQDRTPLSNTEKQTVQNYRDAKAIGQTPEALPDKLQAANDNITALNKAAQANDAAKARLTGDESKAQTIEARDPETYTHLIAQGKGTKLELTTRGDTDNPLSVGSLSKTTSSSKKQTYKAITDEDGNRRVVAVKNNILKDETGRKITQGKQIMAIRDGGETKEPLGTLKLKENQDFLDKELKPYQTKINNLQKEGDALNKVKTKGGVSDARINTLAKKASLLEDPGNMSTLSRSEARSLHDAKLKLRELTNVKEPGTNTPRRLETINRHLIDMNNQVNKISAKYDPENLDQKVFVGKDGKKYTIGKATQDEITKATGQKYYVDPELTSHLNYADSKVSLENTRFVENTKSILEDKQLAYKEGETAPKNFEITNNPYFRGYKLDPKIAEQLDDITGGKPSKIAKSFGKLSNFLKQTIVYIPIKHNFNEAAGYIIDRGLTKWLNPVAYGRMGKSLAAATKSVATHDDFYRSVLKSDFNMMGADDTKLGKVVAQQVNSMSDSPKIVKAMAKAWGMNPARAYKAIQKVSVYDVQDVLNLARINERMQGTAFTKLGLTKKMSLEDAIKDTAKTNFQYKVPSRVAGSRVASELLQGKTPLTYFGHYTYDKFRIAKNILKSTANVSKPKEAIEAADKLAATVAISAVLWPLVDKGLQKVTGDKNAHITAPGVASVAETAQKIAQRKESPTAAAGSQVSVAAPVTIGSQLLGNRNSFTGNEIHDPNASTAAKAKQTLSFLAGQLVPNEKLSTSKNATTNKGLSTLLSLAGASLPKNSPQDTKFESLKYDTLPTVQANAKALAAKGDVQGSINTISAYNKRITLAAQAAFKSEGKPMPTSAQLKSQGYYYDPTLSTVQSWQKGKPSTGTLQAILNTKAAPTKGQPGYKAYEKRQAAKAKQSKAFNKSHPQLNQPITALP